MFIHVFCCIYLAERVFELHQSAAVLQPDPHVHLWNRSFSPHLCISGNGQEGRGNGEELASVYRPTHSGI